MTIVPDQMNTSMHSLWGRFPIKTERLIIRPPVIDDADEFTRAKRETWDQLKQWMAWAEGDGPEHERDILALACAMEAYDKDEDCMLMGFDKVTQKPIVFTGLHNPDWEKREFEIGYWTRQSAQGRGLVQESTKALIDYAFTKLRATKIKISHADGNDASKRIIQKCGFAFSHIVEADPSDEGRRTFNYQMLKPKLN